MEPPPALAGPRSDPAARRGDECSVEVSTRLLGAAPPGVPAAKSAAAERDWPGPPCRHPGINNWVLSGPVVVAPRQASISGRRRAHRQAGYRRQRQPHVRRHRQWRASIAPTTRPLPGLHHGRLRHRSHQLRQHQPACGAIASTRPTRTACSSAPARRHRCPVHPASHQRPAHAIAASSSRSDDAGATWVLEPPAVAAGFAFLRPAGRPGQPGYVIPPPPMGVYQRNRHWGRRYLAAAPHRQPLQRRRGAQRLDYHLLCRRLGWAGLSSTTHHLGGIGTASPPHRRRIALGVQPDQPMSFMPGL